MPEEKPKPSGGSPAPAGGEGFSRRPEDTGEDPTFADWSEMRLSRAVLYASALIVGAVVLVLVLILLNIL